MRKAILHLKDSDPVLGRIIEGVGPYRIEYLPPNFDALAKSIIYQQLSGKAAQTIYLRVVEATAGRVLEPEPLLALSEDQMRTLGLSRQKIAYLRDLAERTQGGAVSFERLTRMPDHQVMAELTSVKGIGEWTVHMFLIFALRRIDVLPKGDLGIRVAIKKAYEMPEIPSPAEVEEMGRAWRPYSTVASWYLWRSLEDKAGL